MNKLKAKRFTQIFEYLDQDQDGLLDLGHLVTGKSSDFACWTAYKVLCTWRQPVEVKGVA